MKIRVKLWISLLLSMLIALTIAVAIYSGNRRLEDMSVVSAVAAKLQKNVFELDQLIHEYALNATQRGRDQLALCTDKIDELLATAAIRENVEITKKLQSEMEVIRSSFSRVVENNLASTPARTALLLGQIQLKARSILQQTVEFNEEQRDRRAAFRARLFIGAVLGVAVLLAVLALTLVMVQRQVIMPLRGIEKGTAAIAAGDLDYRVAASRPDEIGLLAASFNTMADKLKRSYAELEAEIQQRRAAEKDLLLARDQLEHRVSERTLELSKVNEELRHSQQALQQSLQIEKQLREKAEVLNRAKDEFLATVSHELRTPLSAILGWSRLLKHGLPRDKFDHALEVINRNVDAQRRLIEDVLDVSRIITGKINLKITSVPLESIVKTVVDSLRLAAEAKDVRVDTRLQPVSLAGDADRLQQVVWNLVTNAIKFTPAGGSVLVTLTNSGASAVLEVSDTGVGIDPEFLPYVFDRFRQADSSTRRSYGGLGLGLAIVKHLAELHGGVIEARSEGKGRGAAFILTIPIKAVLRKTDEQAPPGAQPSIMTAAGDASLKGRRILVVDDQDDARELISTILSGAGAACDTAPSAREGMDLLKAHDYDALVSDIGMPMDDGYSLLAWIRKSGDARIAATPAIALTAFASSQDRRQVMEAGFQDYLAKPVEPELLVETVARVVGSTAPRA